MPGRYPVGDDKPQVLEALTEAVSSSKPTAASQFCNAALAQLTGSAADTWLGRPSLDLYAPEDQPGRPRPPHPGLPVGEPGPSLLEATLVHHDGARRRLVISRPVCLNDSR